MEPIVVITTEKNILDPGALPFVPAAREEQSLETSPRGSPYSSRRDCSRLGAVEMPTAGDPGSDPSKDVQPPRAKDTDKDMLQSQSASRRHHYLLWACDPPPRLPYFASCFRTNAKCSPFMAG